MCQGTKYCKDCRIYGDDRYKMGQPATISICKEYLESLSDKRALQVFTAMLKEGVFEGGKSNG